MLEYHAPGAAGPLPDEIAEGLRGGFDLPEGHFAPSCWLAAVDDPDYGCEERLTDEVYGRLSGRRLSGPFSLPIEEKQLEACGLDDRMWVGLLETAEGPRPYTWQPDKGCLRPAAEGPWLQKLL